MVTDGAWRRCNRGLAPPTCCPFLGAPHQKDRGRSSTLKARLSRYGVAGYRIVRVLPNLHRPAIPSLRFWDQCLDVASRCLGKSEWTNSANPILMQIDHLRDLVPTHPKSLIGHTGTFSAGQVQHVSL